MAIAIGATTSLRLGPLRRLTGADRVIIGGAVGAHRRALRVGMTQMPELVALLPQLRRPRRRARRLLASGRSVARRARLGIARAADARVDTIEVYLDVIIGAITTTGSVLAFLKLRGSVSQAAAAARPPRVNLAMLLVCVVLGVLYVAGAGDLGADASATADRGLLGVHLVAAIGGADMPVVVSMLNSYSGWAAAAAGFMLVNDLLIITGALVGSLGRDPLLHHVQGDEPDFVSVIFGGFGGSAPAAGDGRSRARCRRSTPTGSPRCSTTPTSVIIVPGYGMAVAQAQHAVRELTERLRAQGRERALRDPPGRRAAARAHERAARRGEACPTTSCSRWTRSTTTSRRPTSRSSSARTTS